MDFPDLDQFSGGTSVVFLDTTLTLTFSRHHPENLPVRISHGRGEPGEERGRGSSGTQAVVFHIGVDEISIFKRVVIYSGSLSLFFREGPQSFGMYCLTTAK